MRWGAHKPEWGHGNLSSACRATGSHTQASGAERRAHGSFMPEVVRAAMCWPE